MEAPMTEEIKHNEMMNAELPSIDFEEGGRRPAPSIEGPFTALVVEDVPGGARSVDGCSVLEDLSADGFYLRLASPMKPGAELLVSVSISHAVVVMRGTVVRVEELEDGCYGMAVAIQQYRMFSELTIDKQAPNDPPPIVAEFVRAEA